MYCCIVLLLLLCCIVDNINRVQFTIVFYSSVYNALFIYLFIYLFVVFTLLSALSAILIGAGTDVPSDSFEVKPCYANM